MKIRRLIVPIVAALLLTACNSEDTTSSTKNGNITSTTKANAAKATTKAEGDNSTNFTKEYALVGYNVYVPKDVTLDVAGYGRIYNHKIDDINYLVTFGCPGASSVFMNLEKVEDAPEASKEYLTHNVEYYRSYFGAAMAQQTIGKTEKVTINGIEMLYTEGELYNKDKPDVKYPYQAYYWLAGGDPVYLLCMAPDHADASAAYLDAMIHCVQKRN